MTKWFGDPWPSDGWRAPVCEDDADRIPPPPAGESCILCEEGFPPDARGIQLPHITGDGTAELHYAHLDCVVDNVGG